jgi:hypothetical protein
VARLQSLDLLKITQPEAEQWLCRLRVAR